MQIYTKVTDLHYLGQKEERHSVGCLAADIILNKLGVKNTIKTEYSSILGQTKPTSGSFPKGKSDKRQPRIRIRALVLLLFSFT